MCSTTTQVAAAKALTPTNQETLDGVVSNLNCGTAKAASAYAKATLAASAMAVLVMTSAY